MSSRRPAAPAVGPALPTTQLRRRYERARRLDPEAQLQDCIDYLQNPEVLVAEFVESFRIVENCDLREHGFGDPERRGAPDAVRERVIHELAEHPRVRVLDVEPYSFQYVARSVVPLPTIGDQEPVAVDYLGAVAGAELIPALGAVCDPRRSTSYVTLLRLLTVLSEIASESQVARLNQHIFKDELERCPAFDLQILLVGAGLNDKRAPLLQLTRDLAHNLRVLLLDEWQFPDLLRQTACLEWPTGKYAGEISSLWSA